MTISTELRLHEASFRAFGSTCRIVSDIETSVPAAIDRLEDLESRWSRFRDNSEVSDINRQAGRWCEASSITVELFSRAVDARSITGGAFNSLMLSQLLTLGYDVSHEQLIHTTNAPATSLVATPASSDGIEIEGARVRIPAGTAFDPGGLGKGLAADLVMVDLLDSGAGWAMVSLGGDIAFGGAALREASPTVRIDDPRTPGAILGSTTVAGGAIATSATTARRWTVEDDVHHHLLDPATGLPAESPRIAATVYAPTAWLADVLAKAIVVDPSLKIDQVESGAEAVAFTASDVIDLGLPVEREGS